MIIIDDTQGFDGVRYYENYAPSLRANRSGLKVMIYNEMLTNEVRRIVKMTRDCDIGVTIHPNGDIRPHRLDEKKSGISEMQINKDTNIANTVTAAHMPKTYGEKTHLRIRKLTPKECWRLMGFDDIDHDRAATVCSNSQRYKQAGNSIVVDVLEHLFTDVRRYL